MATISCRCGKVELQFPSKTPRVSTECCCNSCRQRVEYLADMGGPIVPKKPLLTSKWDNRVEIVSGKDLLFAYKLNPETMVLNIASSCCKTFLLGRHEEYDGNCVTTSSEFPVFHNAEGMVPVSRWFVNQWDKDRLEKCDRSLIGIWVNEDGDGSLTGEEGWEDVFQAQQACIQREIPPDAKGLTFDEIIDEIIGRDNVGIVSQKS